MYGMKRGILFSVLLVGCGICSANAALTSCGPGYVLVDTKQKIDGIPTAECQKLWCRDLETGKTMGSDERANSGYKMSANMVELCDKDDQHCVYCWGERKWCSGEAAGYWSPEHGAYIRDDNVTYQSYQKSGCFAWRLEKPKCGDGKTAILQDGEWVCAVSSGTTDGSRASGVRRTGTMRRIRR